QALQAAFDRVAHILRAAVDAARARVGGVEPDAELGGQEDPVALALQEPAEQFLVGMRAVDVGGVEQGHAPFQRALQGGARLGGVAAAVGEAHAHAAQAEGGDGGAIAAKGTGFHARGFLVRWGGGCATGGAHAGSAAAAGAKKRMATSCASNWGACAKKSSR